MGAYINPSSTTKELWLKENAYAGPNTETPTSEQLRDYKEMNLSLVCLVNNGPFNAAAIVKDERDLTDFTQPGDYRPRLWYVVETEKLMDPAVSSLAMYS